MRYNKMINRSTRNLYFSDFGHDIDESRCSGRSTALALGAISSAMSSPGYSIKVGDHHKTIQASENLCEMINVIIHKLGLRHIAVSKSNRTIMYDPFTENPWEIT